METTNKIFLKVENIIVAPIDKVWAYWTLPEHITKWNFASDDWHTPHAANDLRKGGSFTARMEAKDGSFGFDFAGVYDEVQNNKYIEYTACDGRKVKIDFLAEGGKTKISESFEPESENPHELQKAGWQAIMNNFKKYTEAN